MFCLYLFRIKKLILFLNSRKIIQENKILQKKGQCFWLTGLSGSGKTTLAKMLISRLLEIKIPTILIDGDILRANLNKDLDFSINDRTENIKRAAKIIKSHIDSGTNIIATFISPTNEIREIAKNIIDENYFNLIYVECSLESCEKRDPKGLYKKARNGEIENFTGISSIFENPIDPNIIVNTDINEPNESLKEIFNFVVNRTGIK